MTLHRKILFFAASLLLATPALAVDDVDKAAIEDLRVLVAAECKANPQCPLDDLFSRLQEPIVANMTAFETVMKDGNSSTMSLPDTRPDGVTADEWQALQISGIKDVHSDIYDTKSYTLVDLDGDGQRDLVINDDITGESSNEISTWAFHRQGDKFDGLASFREDNYDGGFLYLNTEYDGSTAAHWIRLRGRIYAVWRFTHYGYDDLYLLRPFVTNHEVPILTVRYHYRLAVSVEEASQWQVWFDLLSKDTALNGDKLSKALTKALQSMSDKTPNLATPKTPLCPIPASVKGDDRKQYYAYRADSPDSDDSSEESDNAVGDMPIQAGGKCYIARLFSTGVYDADGVVAGVRMQATGGEYGWDFKVSGTRKMISVEISTRKCDKDGCY